MQIDDFFLNFSDRYRVLAVFLHSDKRNLRMKNDFAKKIFFIISTSHCAAAG
ncbi:MAG: hypothetical protein ACI9LN_002359, partial [Saprospiraceae bacterium]